MQLPKKYLHDKVVLILLTVIVILLVVGVALVLLRFDSQKNPLIISQYRQNLAGQGYISGKPIDIYGMAIYMVITAVAGVAMSIRTFAIRRTLSIFLLASTALLLIIGVIISNSLISLQ